MPVAYMIVEYASVRCIQFLKWKLYRCWYLVYRVSHLNTFENVLHKQNFEGNWYLHRSECRIWKTMAWRRLCSGYESVIPCTCVYSFQQMWYCTNTCMESFAVWFFFISVTSTEYKILYWEFEPLVQNFLSGCKMCIASCSLIRADLFLLWKCKEILLLAAANSYC